MEAVPQSNQDHHSPQGSQQDRAAAGATTTAPASAPAGGGSGTGGAGRRVTIGGLQGNPNATTMDRRGSLASMGFNVDEFLSGRRGSLGFDTGLDSMLMNRRGSMDSGSAALESALLSDYARRRYSMAMGNDDLFQGSSSLPSFAGMGGMGAGMGGMGAGMGGMGGMSSLMSHQQQQQSGGSGMGSGANPASALAARQQMLQQQQRELEQRQRELEIQRQQLISSMQERNYMPGLPSSVSAPQTASANFGLGSSMRGGPGPLDISTRSGLDISTRGLDMSTRGLDVSTRGLDMSTRGAGLDASARSAMSSVASQSSQWWICQICNAKAFASHEEAMAHEDMCRRRHDPLNPISLQDMPGASRNFSLGMDSSTHSAYDIATNISTGPFAQMEKPLPLAMDSDKDWLTPLHCFVRRHCVEIFTASESDVATPSKGKRKPISVGQVGIRCPHCRHEDLGVSRRGSNSSALSKGRERGSIYYPTTISSIYNATMNLLQRHLHSCTAVPDDIMRRYETLKADDARSGTSKRYWIESALSLGLVDTAMGIRFSARSPPPLPSLTSSQETEGHAAVHRNDNDFFSSNSNAVTELPDESEQSKASAVARVPAGESVSKSEQDMATSAPLVTPEDKPYSTNFSYHLLSQMQPCVFTEADRLGKRKGLPPGFPGLACRHCFGGYGSGRFFPSSIKTLSDTSKTLNVLHNHMMRCRKCPAEVRESLERLRGSHDEERSKMKFGSQKAFFARIWDRLHGKDAPPKVNLKRKAAPTTSSSSTGKKSSSKKKAPPQSSQPPMTAGPGTNGLDALARASDPKRLKTD